MFVLLALCDKNKTDSTSCSVNAPSPDHVRELVLCWTESVVAHDPAELAHGDLPVVVRVEERERLLQAVQLGVRQLRRVTRRERFRPEK